jgi:hypothetical protein
MLARDTKASITLPVIAEEGRQELEPLKYDPFQTPKSPTK